MDGEFTKALAFFALEIGEDEIGEAWEVGQGGS